MCSFPNKTFLIKLSASFRNKVYCRFNSGIDRGKGNEIKKTPDLGKFMVVLRKSSLYIFGVAECKLLNPH